MILIIDKSRKRAEAYADILKALGYLACGTTPVSALNEITSDYHAIIISSPKAIKNLNVFLSFLCAEISNVPIFAIGNTDDSRIALCISDTLSADTVIKRISRYITDKRLPMIGAYTCAGFDASVSLCNVLYFSKMLRLTKTEKMIFRYLAVSFPSPKTSQLIVRFCISSSRSPSPATIRSHISSINRKFRALTGRSIIEHRKNRGYIMITPLNEKIFE